MHEFIIQLAALASIASLVLQTIGILRRVRMAKEEKKERD